MIDVNAARRATPACTILASLPLLGDTFNNGGPTSNNDDDTCDIGLLPAATLLLPRFDVDIADTSGTGKTTAFSITNVTPIASRSRR